MSTLWLLVALLAPDGGIDAGLKPDAAAPPAPAPVGAPPVVEMTCAPSPIRIGEALVCTVSVLHRADVTIAVSAPAGAETQDPAPPQPKDGQLLSTRTFTLRPMAITRKLTVDGVTVVWEEVGSATARIQVPAQRVPVKSVIAGQADPKFRTFLDPQVDPDSFWTAHGPLPYQITNWPLIIGLIVFGGVGLGLGIGIIVARWLRGRVVEDVVYVDPRPAHVIAFERLDQLALKNLPAQGEIKAHYTSLSEIVRDYLERRYQFAALEMTSDEIRAEIAKHDVPSKARVVIEGFLDETDLVKFADFRPDDTSTDAAMRFARGLVELTRQSDEETQAATLEVPA